jgi:hypothetical protein
MKPRGSAFAEDAESCGSAERAKAAVGRILCGMRVRGVSREAAIVDCEVVLTGLGFVRRCSGSARTTIGRYASRDRDGCRTCDASGLRFQNYWSGEVVVRSDLSQFDLSVRQDPVVDTSS